MGITDVMNCKAILRKSPRAGQQCDYLATRGWYCVVHDPLVVIPRLEAKRDKLKAAVAVVEGEIASYDRPEDEIQNAS